MKSIHKAVFLASALTVVSPAIAADVGSPAVKSGAAPVVISGCTLASCTGFTLGVNVTGAGTSSQVGLNTSSLAAGGMIGGQFGWQTWNGQLLLGVNVIADYDATGTNGGKPGYFFAETLRLGGAVQNFFTGNPVVTQAPLQIGGATPLAPFIDIGVVERPFGVGWATGTGMEFALGGPWMGEIGYLHVGYNATVNPGLKVSSEDIVRIGINRKF